METIRGTNNTMVKIENKKVVRQLIYYHGPISKQEIADSLHLSLVTVSQNLKELFAEGLIRKEGSLQSTGGRRASLLAFNKEYWYAIGIEFRGQSIVLCLIDFSGVKIEQSVLRQDFTDTEPYWTYINERIAETLERHDIDRKNLAIIGLALPGIIHYSNRTIRLEKSLLPEQPVLSIDYLKSKFAGITIVKPVPVSTSFIDVFNIDRESFDRIYLDIDDTLHGTIIIKGNLLTGSDENAGSFGHMIIDTCGNLCDCGKRGCLESYCSTRVLASQGKGDLKEFFTRLESGESEALSAWDDYLAHLAIGLSNLLEIFDMRIKITGPIHDPLVASWPLLLEKLGNLQSRENLGHWVEVSSWGNDPAAYGIALMAIMIFLIPEFQNR